MRPPGLWSTRSPFPLRPVAAALILAALVVGGIAVASDRGSGDPDRPPASSGVTRDESADLVASLSPKELAVVLEVTELGSGRALAVAIHDGEVDFMAVDAEVRARSAAAPQGFGDDHELDSRWQACDGGSFPDCDALYRESGIGTAYEAFADTCGRRRPPGAAGRCEQFAALGELDADSAG